MADVPDWLPDLVLFEDYNGNWQRYVEAVYACFKADFLDKAVLYRGNRLGIKRYPEYQGKSATFWHIVSEGQVEVERLPDLRRCERIKWPCAVIENSMEPDVKVWENERRGERRLCLWLEEREFLVILAIRNGYYLLWTAYCVMQYHQKTKLQREYEAWKKADAAP
ncbi:MAG: rflB [Chthonomonadales bacterium]|nr:rflB [Chthonomonadales bacterium]